MSAASKEFERITQAIFQRLREHFGFERVEGSRKYKGKRSGRKRQIDATGIKPDGTMSPIECKLHKRKVGIEDLDKFNWITYAELEADEGIIVSSSGFDAGAEAAGRGNNLRLATLNKDATECKRQEQSEPRAIGKTEPPPFQIISQDCPSCFCKLWRKRKLSPSISST
jgi:predicted helicase